MILRTLALSLSALTLAMPAKADKFHLDSKDDKAKTQGGGPGRVIEGVLIEKDDKAKTYRIRVLGGEVILAQSAVKSIEKDTLTVAMIETMEKDQAEQLAQQDQRRRDVQAAEASARRTARAERRASAVNQERTLPIEIDFQGLVRGYTFKSYDPVLHRANLSGLTQLIENYLRQEVERAAHR
jgi:hypothetical protein